MEEVYVSTGGFGQFLVDNTARNFNEVGIKNIELSGGIISPKTLSCLKKLRKENCKFILHNYFPKPMGEDFVLNLGSSNQIIKSQSRELILNALRWSSELHSKLYAIHAPFRLDPCVSDLGKGFPSTGLQNLNETVKIFCNEYNELRVIGKKLGVELAIENNVLSAIDFDTFGREHPFIFTGQDCDIFSKYIGQDYSVLADLAHLKVSANSLQMNPWHILSALKNKISWFHLSENDGLTDTNTSFNDSAWFWKSPDLISSPVTIEVYNESAFSLKKIQNYVKEKLYSE